MLAKNYVVRQRLLTLDDLTVAGVTLQKPNVGALPKSQRKSAQVLIVER